MPSLTKPQKIILFFLFIAVLVAIAVAIYFIFFIKDSIAKPSSPDPSKPETSVSKKCVTDDDFMSTLSPGSPVGSACSKFIAMTGCSSLQQDGIDKCNSNRCCIWK